MHVHVLQDGELLPRGVWLTPYTIDGFPYLIAVDSRGERVREQVCRDGLDPGRAARTLVIALDAVDKPRVHATQRGALALVRPERDDGGFPGYSTEITLCLAKYGYYKRMG